MSVEETSAMVMVNIPGAVREAPERCIEDAGAEFAAPARPRAAHAKRVLSEHVAETTVVIARAAWPS